MLTHIRLARQPIVSVLGKIYAYELLFRDINQFPDQSAEDFIIDNQRATSRVTVNALNQFGIQNIVGEHTAFLNSDEDFLVGDAILSIPPKRFIIEVLEHVKMSPKLLERIIFLKTKGYRFALDDATFDQAFLENFASVLEHIDVLKVDIKLIKPEDLEKILPYLKSFNFKLLAEKVETKEEFQTYKNLGCELFQGYFFAKPEIREQETLDTHACNIIKLIQVLDEDITHHQLVSEFEMFPEISLQLLKYLNSADISLKSSITSIAYAIQLIGKRPLKNWLLLISFSMNNEHDNQDSPLFELARSRSFMMAHLASVNHKEHAYVDQASFVGLLSLIENIFHVSLEVILNEMHIASVLKNALLEYEGDYGNYLRLVIHIEKMEELECLKLIKTLNISQEQLHDSIMKTYAKLSQ